MPTRSRIRDRCPRSILSNGRESASTLWRRRNRIPSSAPRLRCLLRRVRVDARRSRSCTTTSCTPDAWRSSTARTPSVASSTARSSGRSAAVEDQRVPAVAFEHRRRNRADCRRRERRRAARAADPAVADRRRAAARRRHPLPPPPRPFAPKTPCRHRTPRCARSLRAARLRWRAPTPRRCTR